MRGLERQITGGRAVSRSESGAFQAGEGQRGWNPGLEGRLGGDDIRDVHRPHRSCGGLGGEEPLHGSEYGSNVMLHVL